MHSNVYMGLPRWLSGKESACQAGDTDSIPGSGISPGEQMATPSSILAGEFPWDRGAWRATVHGVAKSWTWLSGYTAAQIW